ncbi:MAG: ABC transporter substrate-binding protein [Cyanobacteriota bacterium]|nr:ABC transporter substrate-binding protein [Cyanobacteriota bacterium]
MKTNNSILFRRAYFVVFVMLLTALLLYVVKTYNTTNFPSIPPTERVIPPPHKYKWEPTRFSRGERTLFPGTGNFNRDRGIKAFEKGNYSEAQDFFDRAMNADPNDPEVRIYYNNTLARQQPDFLTLAAVVPAHNNEGSAKEMLRGVAQAQDEFNQAASDSGGQFLEIVIANDGNEPDMSKQVARELVKDTKVLGIIGHNASSASEAALVEYEKAGLPMISPTSSSTELSSEFFFRTVPSDEATGQKLAEYAKGKDFDRVVVFYNPKSSYSKSLQDAFDRSFRALGGRVVRTVDLNDEELNADEEIRISVEEEGVKAVVLFPNTDTTSVAVEIAKANIRLPEQQQLQLFGGDTLYSGKILSSAKEAVAGLILAIPWFARSTEPEGKNSRDFALNAVTMWGAEVSWRTATSYDATWALIRALNLGSTESPSRESVFKELPDIKLASERTSGDQIFVFSSRKERQSEPILVKVVSGTGSPQGSGFGFERVEE